MSVEEDNVGEQVSNGFGAAWGMFATFVPKLLGFLLILFVGWLIAKGLSKAFGLLLSRTNFSRLVERSGFGSTLTRGRFDVGTLLQKLVYYFVLLIALQYAFGVWGENNAVSLLLSAIVAWLPKLAVAIILVLIAGAIGRAANDLIRSALGGRAYATFMARGAQYFILALGVIAALSQIGVATSVTMPVLITALAVVGGIAVVGIGGGAIRPMQQRWETWLLRADREFGSAAATSSSTGRPSSTPDQRMGEHDESRQGAHRGNVAQEPRPER
jgi:small-conductance mechanosensitive channel